MRHKALQTTGRRSMICLPSSPRHHSSWDTRGSAIPFPFKRVDRQVKEWRYANHAGILHEPVWVTSANPQDKVTVFARCR